jgi:predicted Zn-dependent protease
VVGYFAVDRAQTGHYNLSMHARHGDFDQRRRCCSLLLVIALVFGSCSSHRSSIPGLTPPAEEDDIRIGREFRREARKHLNFVPHPEAERYIQIVGQRLLAAMGPQPFDYRFFIVEDSQLNAFAVPGGSIYLYTGLIEKAKSTAEIAAVMGHEIIHIKGRHMARSAGPDAVSLVSLVGALLLARSGAAAQAAGAVGQALAATRQIAYSRQLEMEADTLGARYMSAAGYDPSGSLSFLRILDQERALNPIDIPVYLMTHPVTQERVANVELVIRSLGKIDVRTEPEYLQRIQTIIRMRSEADKVIEEHDRRVRQNPQDAASIHLLAFAQHLKGLLPQARQNYESARKLNLQHPALDRDLGRLYSETGDFPLAHMAFERALAHEPKEPLTYLYLGELYEKENDLVRAAGAYLYAHNLSPLWDKPVYRLSLVYGKLNRLGDAHYYLGRFSLIQDEDDKAIAEFEKAIKMLGEQSPRAQSIREEIRTVKSRKR